MHASVRTLPLLALGVVVPAAVLVAAIAVPASAAPAAGLPSAKALLAKVAASSDAHYSGTVTQTSDLGLPQLPSVGPGSAASADSDEAAILDLVTAPHTAKVYVDGTTKQRVQVLDQLAERDVVRSGSSVWIWDSKEKSATHVTLASKTAATPAPSSPADLVDQLLTAVDGTTKVTVTRGPDVAGRHVDRLVLTPRTDQTLVAKVVVSVDAATGVPLKVAVDARGQSDDAVSVGFTDISYATPDAGLFSFTPPRGATVTTKDLSARTGARPDHQTQDSPSARPSGAPTVTGTGWASVVTLPGAKLPADVSSDPLFGELTTAVTGGRALQTSLVSVLITDDGRVLAGAVPVSTLEAAAQ